MKTPRLDAPGIVLRELERADAPALFLALGDADIQKYRRAPPHTSITETEAYVDDTLARGYGWAITESDGEALGRIALRVPRDGIGEFGILLRREAQGRGLASKAVDLVIKFAFETLALHRLSADIDADNNASLSLFLRAGFQREALLRCAAITHRGPRDSVIMGKLRGAA